MEEPLSRVRIVLCRPSHPGNVGAAARAMKAMGLADLRIVNGASRRAPEALAMAANSTDVLDAAREHESLVDALGGCVRAFAFSARAREWAPQRLDVRHAARDAIALAFDGPVALVFGNETAGLTNEEMFACQVLVRIPTCGDFSSLNLAQAVQIAAYELAIAAGAALPVPAHVQRRATVEDLEGLYRHIEEVAVSCGFLDPVDPKRFRERLRRIISRAALEREEVNIVRGLLRALRRGGDSKY